VFGHAYGTSKKGHLGAEEWCWRVGPLSRKIFLLDKAFNENVNIEDEKYLIYLVVIQCGFF
jgi:hypothetical protein